MTYLPHPDHRFGDQQPGVIPLRPLRTGEILSAGLQVMRRHFWVVAPPALLFALIGSAVTWLTLVATDSVADFVSGEWAVQLTADGTLSNFPVGLLAASTLSMFVAIGGGILTSGLAAVAAAQDALGQPTPRAHWRERLTGRILALLVVSVLVGLAVALGTWLLIVPGLLAYLMWLVAGPATVLERATPIVALQRSASLTTGHRMRLFGVVLVLGVAAVLAAMLLGALLGSLTPNASPGTILIVSEAAGSVASMVTGAWSGCVIAIAYIDLRIRKENLAPTLAAAARSANAP